jgi:hypothetical protein
MWPFGHSIQYGVGRGHDRVVRVGVVQISEVERPVDVALDVEPDEIYGWGLLT